MARKILLADDSVTAQNMGRKILADAGYEVIAVNNGSAALKKIAEVKPELVVLDVYMPGYSGLEVCQRLKESPETARIPVLLTVGKLEPFKPEEAQRVRAEGYIVKPFEASELLSALSKLEDKMVHRPEPSRPGRFSRAMAAVEEPVYGSRSEPSNGESGWKSRIAFPHQKTESEQNEDERLEEQPASPVSRDLRTVVEAFEEKTKRKTEDKKTEDKKKDKKEETKEKEDQRIGATVDVAALAPEGLPKDVTPQELAAITAAAAQIQMAGAVSEELEAIQPVANSEASATNVVASEPPAPEVDHQRRKDDKRSEETQPDEPVTMAVATESAASSGSGASRWAAVSVALEGDEAAVSLHSEMQKAYAAAAGVGSGASASLPRESYSAPEPVQTEAPTISNSEPEFARQPEPASSTQSTENNSAQAAQFETPVAAPSPVEETVSSSDAPAGISAIAESSVADQEPASSVIESKIAETLAPVSASLDVPQAEAATVEPPSGSSSGVAASTPEQHEPEHRHEVEPQLESETVKSTAAAWASWRQIRDTGKESEASETQPREFEAPQSAPEEIHAKAVAAGAEQLLQEAAAADPNRNPSDVASIVDSVLADLRPKLMEEISRKMAEKK